ncbi:monocarboxylate transporter 12 [Plakobranchus ocellatus]|uniref:Monocarboxylate transporter 12 n=1 Tax=Plakobranchus ocellatus TaxID=259542 RepID=A0AAV4AT60_9GAST|nr:monocarboxylate transporter 12 [Plakobranchus ocellatus]
MPCDDDDASSSLQRQKLLHSDRGSASASPSTVADRLTPQHLPLYSGTDTEWQSLSSIPSSKPATPRTPRSRIPHRFDQESASVDETEGLPPGVDPDGCYAWLLPPPPLPKRPGSDDSLSSVTSRSSLPIPPPPDGGWGWFVVLGAFTVSLICDGLSYCFGVLYSELLVHFGESRSKTSLVGSIFFGVAMILGPFASALTTRFGCRKMTIFGGLLSSFGFLLSYFATSIDMLCFTFSVVVGAGFSFCYITSVVIVAFYFDKRRALATGLAVCGTGVGTFTFAPLMDFLINEYGWRGLFLIMAGISLNLVVCGMLFRPLQFTEAQRCQMLLEEFNKIPPSREELETARSGRYPSDSGDSDSDSSTGVDGCWGGRSKGSSYTDEEDESEKSLKYLSVLSLPTFVRRTGLANQSPSPVLIEALRSSKNPHLTMQRYMKNAYLQLEQARLYARRSRRHKSERVTLSSPVDSAALTVSELPPLQDSLRSEYLGRSPQGSPYLFSRSHHNGPSDSQSSRDVALANGQSAIKPVYITGEMTFERAPDDLILVKIKDVTDHSAFSKVSSATEKPDSKDHSSVKTSHKDLAAPHHFGLSIFGSALVEKHRDGNKRPSSVYLGRHSALSIHLPLYRTDIFYRRLRTNNLQKQSCTLGTSCPELTDPRNQLSRSRGQLEASVSNFLADAGGVLKGMVEFRLFFNPFFLLFVVSNFIYYFWSDVPYMYAADHAVTLGQDSTSASFMLSIIGIFNTIGQVVFGYIGDLNVNLLNIYAIVSALAGVFVAFVPFVHTYFGMCTLYAFFGFCISVSFPLTTVLLVNYLGVARLTNAYGLLMLMQGIANLFGPPFAGWVSDRTGSYNAAFVLSGFFYIVSGLVLFLAYLPACKKFEAARSRRTSLGSSTSAPAEKEIPTSWMQHLGEEGSHV